MIDLLLLSIGFIGVVIASISDLKKREVPDWLCYSMIIAGLGIRVLTSITNSTLQPFLSGILAFGAAFILANIFYYTKQWGGGDSKLLMGVGAVFGNGLSIPGLTPSLDWPFLTVFVFNLIILGAFYGLFYAFCLALKNGKRLVQSLEHQSHLLFKKASVTCSLLAIFFLFIISFFFFQNQLRFFGIALSFILTVLALTLFLVKDIEKVALEQWTGVDKLTEGDWIAKEVRVGKKILCSPEDLGLTKHQIFVLKEYHIKKVLVKQGIPFVPSFLLSLIATLVWGNFIFTLI